MPIQTACLNGQEITYTLTRSRRKSIGLQINQQGLRISAPLHTPLLYIDTVLQQKADWITKKLTQWQEKKSLAPAWTLNATYPLLGEPWRITIIKPTGEIVMTRSFDHELPQPLGQLQQPRHHQPQLATNPTTATFDRLRRRTRTRTFLVGQSSYQCNLA